MSSPGTLEVVGEALAKVFEPLGEALETQDSARELLGELGLSLPESFFARQATLTALDAAVVAIGELPGDVTDLTNAIAADDTGGIVAAGQELIASVQAVVVAIDAVADEIDEAATVVSGLDPADLTAFVQELPERLFNYLAVRYLERNHQAVLGVLYLVGLADRGVERADANDPLRPAAYRHDLRLDRIPELFEDPTALFTNVYGWGTNDLDIERILYGLHQLLSALGFLSVINRDGPEPVLRTVGHDIGHRPDVSPNPVEAEFRFGTGAGLSRTVDLGNGWEMVLTFEASIDGGAILRLSPPFELEIEPTSIPIEGAANVEFVRTNGPGGAPVILVGLAGGPRLEADAIAVRVGTDLSWDAVAGVGRADFEAAVALRDGRVVIALDDADGFLTGLLGEDGLVIAADIEAGWNATDGLFFRGGAGIEIDVPVDLNLGAITISSLYLALGFTDGAISLEASGAIGAKLGPFAVAVERMGLEAALSFPASGGNLEVANLDFLFKPPSGLGFVLDAGVVKGGGYLYFEHPEYAGVLELTLGPVGVKAIGILTTELPDGDDGWALLLLVFSEFTGVQLGFGFTLNGVGGIIGLQHGVSTEALQSGLRTGILDSVLFPADPVANAPELLGDLRAVFPITPGALTVGPALKIGWGTPALISITLGLVLQFDDVLNSPDADAQLTRIVLLGQLQVQAPPAITPDTPALLKLLIDIVGVYEVREKSLAIDAALRDSHVALLPITGSLTVRANFGSNPSFIMAVGGFHPRFTDIPPGVPEQDRLGIQLDYDIVTIRIVGYTAITSNTFQVGAEASLVAAAAGFRVEAYLGFDALFIFKPTFSFEIDFRVGASIRWRSINLASISVHGTVSGPGHWVVSGHAAISILFWDVEIDVEVEWGSAPATPLPSVAVRELLVEALEQPENWLAQLPSGTESLVTLRQPITSDVLAHPLGEVAVMQRVVPLGIDIDRVDTSVPSDGNRFDIDSISIGGGPSQTPTYSEEHFARAKYLDLTEEEKLSTPSFEQFRAGAAISSSSYTVGGDQVAFDPDMETVYLEQPDLVFITTLPLLVTLNAVSTGAASASMLRKNDRLRALDDDVAVAVADPGYAVADVTLSVDDEVGYVNNTMAKQMATAQGNAVILEAAEAVTLS